MNVERIPGWCDSWDFSKIIPRQQQKAEKSPSMKNDIAAKQEAEDETRDLSWKEEDGGVGVMLTEN